MGTSSKRLAPLAKPVDAEPDPLDQLLERSIVELADIGLRAAPLAPLQTTVSRSEPYLKVPVRPAPSNVDPFANINACTSEHIDVLANILEVLGAQPWQTRIREECFRAASLSSGMSILEIGCGTGVVARELARIAGPEGRVVGLDVSPALLGYARQRTAASGLCVEYVLGDAYNLPFPDRVFDASCCFTLLAHLEDLDRAVRELLRVTRHNVMLFDQDYQTLVFENSDTRLTRKILQHGADYNVLDGWCGRKLPGMLVRHGVRDVQCQPFVYSERDAGSYLITIAERFATLAARHDVITEEERGSWLQELHDRAREGTFFASLNYYFAFGMPRGEPRNKSVTMEVD